ncbi:unnamed protein product [Fusarium venenatum]|uniref:Uncharacterized protein n=1 Tax=Fusarium venenatum TaxID=56646 RepID=A0A2L2T663_9HYPO|nr:uncharacterized protein FVRRES_13610 [Fusarium venenatum]CEI41505.1 unnamed protein product [Fusarium venenatum]
MASRILRWSEVRIRGVVSLEHIGRQYWMVAYRGLMYQALRKTNMGWACMGTLETVGRNSGQDDGLQTHQGAHGNVIELTKQNLAVHKLNVVVRMNRKQFVSLGGTGLVASYS